MENIRRQCPCSSGKDYEVCCKKYHQGAVPENALVLMRSRYSAYAFNLPEYIIATTHPASPQYSDNMFIWKRSISRFALNTVFHKLEVLDFKESAHMAQVVFTAFISQGGQEATFTERSYFDKVHERWLYRGGNLSQGYAPNLVTTGQLRLLPLAYYGDSILRRKGDPIVEITEDIRRLAEEMIDTMEASNGMGLAAPQVHHSIRLFVIRTPIETDKDKIEYGDINVFINPVLSMPDAETWKASEGCLSIPTLRAEVERPRGITVEYTTLEDEKVQERVSGWHARVIMHEYDHIDGLLFIDRLNKQELDKITPFLQNLEKRIHDGREL